MSKRLFPIKIEPACLLKWSWSTVYLNSGSTSSCHRTERYSIDPNNFSDFHNVPEKIRDRKMMLNGQWPGHGCEYCRHVEEAGGISDRQFQLNLQKDRGLTPPELNNNVTATSITPTILEVYFTNTCNMSCIYCGPHFSSKWEDENRKFKSNFNDQDIKFSVANSFDNPNYDQMVKGLWEYLEKDQNYLILRRFHILGGEPFLLKETDDVISFWESHPNNNLVISIISNLNIPHKRFVEYMLKFENLIKENKIWKVQLTASLDGWGIEQEYTRYGLDLKLWEKNFEWLLDKEWANLSINSALSCLTLKKLPILIKKINEWNTKRGTNKDRLTYSFNTTGTYDDIYIFGPNVFDKELKLAIDLMPTNLSNEKENKIQLESVLKTLNNSKKNQTKIEKLKNYLSILDKRRNTDWQKTFPWLVDI